MLDIGPGPAPRGARRASSACARLRSCHPQNVIAAMKSRATGIPAPSAIAIVPVGGVEESAVATADAGCPPLAVVPAAGLLPVDETDEMEETGGRNISDATGTLSNGVDALQQLASVPQQY